VTTRDRRRARTRRRETTYNMPLYNEPGMRHNERVMRQQIEEDRQTQPERFRRKGKQQIPIGKQDVKDARNMPNMNQEGIEHNKRVVEETKEKDREEAMTPEEKARLEHKKSALQKLRDFFNTKV